MEQAFTQITQHHFLAKQGREHIWSLVTDTPFGFLAGTLLGTEIIRIRFVHAKYLDDVHYQLVDGKHGTLPYHSWAVIKGDEHWPTINDESTIQATLEPYLQGLAFSATTLRLTRPLTSKEYIYGLGEHTGDMNKRGQVFPIWNIDPPQRHSAFIKSMYTSIPFYIGLQPETGRAYGVLIDHTGLVEMDMGKTQKDTAIMTIQGDSLVAYFFVGPTTADVLRQYTELTGRMPLPARWTLGHHQCRWSYMTQQHIEEIAASLRARNHPCDAIWLDIDYMQGYRNFTWNPETFPGPTKMAQKLHEQHFQFVTIIDPGTKIDDQYSVYREGMQRDYFCRYDNGEIFIGNVWPGACVFPDYSREEVRAWWGNLYRDLIEQGVDAFWNDMNEPSLTNFLNQDDNAPTIHGTTMADNVLHRAGGEQQTGPDGPPVLHKFSHNAYGMEMARSTYEGLLRQRPTSRPFVLTRSGTTGVQRYAAVWTGDNSSEWEHIRLAITMCLNLGISGVPFNGADVGGFWGPSNGELLVRFAQLGALMPFSRNHNAMGNPDQEPWAFGEPYESAYRKAMELRYQLMPHLYTLFQQAATDGSPIMRPLYYHYPQDEQAHDAQDEFLLGDTLLSAPIYEAGATSRSVYLPAGLWFDYWDGTEYPGETISELPASLERWPLLVRANSILASGPTMQYTGQRPTDPLTFTCFMTADGLANYTLYEDDGTTQAYRSNTFARTQVSCREAGDIITVRIDEQHNNYQPERREYEIVVHIGNRTMRQRLPAGQGTIVAKL